MFFKKFKKKFWPPKVEKTTLKSCSGFLKSTFFSLLSWLPKRPKQKNSCSKFRWNWIVFDFIIRTKSKLLRSCYSKCRRKSSRKNQKSIILQLFFRTFDGSCNNKRNPKYGQALTPLQRVLPNAYADQILTPRRAKNRGPLPSARLSSFVKIWYYELTKAIWVSSLRRRDTKLDRFLAKTQHPDRNCWVL